MINEAGYAKLRGLYRDNFNYIGITLSDDSELIRLKISGEDADARITIISDGTTNPYEFHVTLKETDADIPVDSVVKGYKLYDVATGGEALQTETLSTNYVFNSEFEMVLRHRQYIPKIVE